MHYIVVFVAAFLAGAINSVAGGGTLLTFPSLLAAGISPVAANATSTVALVPASFSAWWGYRRESQKDKTELLWLGVPSIIGGIIGAVLVIKAGDKLFGHMVPWLILGATALFIIQDPIRRWIDRHKDDDETIPGNKPHIKWPFLSLFQSAVAVYGGFFGAGIGIMMLAALGLAGFHNIHRMNRLKNFAAVCINGVASITFILQHRVQWWFVILMLIGSVPGGYAGAWIAQKVGQGAVKKFVMFVGLAIGIYMLVKPIK